MLSEELYRTFGIQLQLWRLLECKYLIVINYYSKTYEFIFIEIGSLKIDYNQKDQAESWIFILIYFLKTFSLVIS